jgi:hypothetical protein
MTHGVGPINVRAADPFNGRSVEWLLLRHGKGRYEIGAEGEAIIGIEETWDDEMLNNGAE